MIAFRSTCGKYGDSSRSIPIPSEQWQPDDWKHPSPLAHGRPSMDQDYTTKDVCLRRKRGWIAINHQRLHKHLQIKSPDRLDLNPVPQKTSCGDCLLTCCSRNFVRSSKIEPCSIFEQ
jgi:hypothetical protein